MTDNKVDSFGDVLNETTTLRSTKKLLLTVDVVLEQSGKTR